MKKTILAAVMLLGALTMSAQSYEHSLGVSVGNLFGVSYKGFFFGVEGLGMQIDLGCKLSNWGKNYSQTVTQDPGETTTTSFPRDFDENPNSVNYFTFEVNPNIVYNLPIHSGSYGSLAFCAGGGISLGMLKYGPADDVWMDENRNKKNFWWAMSQTAENYEGKKEALIRPEFKFGINALVGLELDLDAVPLVVGFDFRPGYGMGYDSQDIKGVKTKTITNFFDWTLAASLRYKF